MQRKKIKVNCKKYLLNNSFSAVIIELWNKIGEAKKMKVEKIISIFMSAVMLSGIMAVNVQAAYTVPQKTVSTIIPATRGDITRTDNGDGTYSFAIKRSMYSCSRSVSCIRSAM